MRRAQHLEDRVQTFASHHVTDTNIFGIFRRDTHRQIALGNLQDEILFLLAFDGSGLDRFDQRCTVMWIDNGVSDLKYHLVSCPFRYPILTRRISTCSPTVQVRGTPGEPPGLTW
ncbi:Uncharacterised protein [Mycobacteroides abscessus subsp. abscessus]|nr:Uncharacterised protein [Mycobacteroides abscessus subsp. abscessus]